MPAPWLELRALVQERTLSAYIADMCGRFTRNYTWEQIHALYRLTAPPAIPTYNRASKPVLPIRRTRLWTMTTSAN